MNARTPLVVLLFVVAACGGGEGPSGLADVPGDAIGTAPDVIETAPDAIETALPACLGEARVLTVSSVLPFADVAIGGAKGAFLLDLATTRSTIDLAAFDAPPAAYGCDPSLAGQSCGFDGFEFFGPWGAVTLVTADHSGVVASVRQAGILGTDFLSVHAFTLDYDGGRVLRARAPDFCDGDALAGAGFVALPCDGFFGVDPATLRPLSDVVAGAAPGTHVPNVPTVPLRIAGVTAHAQLDTGFDDVLVPLSVNVNVAFLDAIQSAAPAALARVSSKDLALSTCVPGVIEPVEAYALEEGSAAGLVDASGALARAWPSATLFVKRTPSAALVCGGIGTWDVPAAQLSGSFAADLGVVVFDPFGGRVWVRPSESEADSAPSEVPGSW